jgi:uncharacterized damage-inducible protein DinB
MTPTYFQDIYRYNFWANRLVWSCFDSLTDDQFNAPDGERDSIRQDLIHVMGVEHWWLVFIATGKLDFLNADDYPTRVTIRAKWDRIETNVLAFLSTVTDQDLQRQVRPEFWQEGRQPIYVWQALAQVANHSTDHRAQILSRVRQLGGTTVEQDYLTYLFEQQSAAS